MNEWNIQSRAHECQACGRAFANREAYHTLLFDEKQAYVRLDVCAACWSSQYSQGARDRKGFISHWQGIFEAPPPAPPEPIRRETAETLLRKLIELNDPQYVAVGFILAVMLERKRLLKVKEQLQQDGRRVFIYEQPRTGDLFTVPDPQLQLNQLEQVQRDVAQLLEHGLPDPAAGQNTQVLTPAGPVGPPVSESLGGPGTEPAVAAEPAPVAGQPLPARGE